MLEALPTYVYVKRKKETRDLPASVSRSQSNPDNDLPWHFIHPCILLGFGIGQSSEVMARHATVACTSRFCLVKTGPDAQQRSP